jgi:hypothetical protein
MTGMREYRSFPGRVTNGSNRPGVDGCNAGWCGHVSDLVVRHIAPLAIVPKADEGLDKCQLRLLEIPCSFRAFVVVGRGPTHTGPLAANRLRLTVSRWARIAVDAASASRRIRASTIALCSSR